MRSFLISDAHRLRHHRTENSSLRHPLGMEDIDSGVDVHLHLLLNNNNNRILKCKNMINIKISIIIYTLLHMYI